MWLKWFPWRFIISRLARSEGFLDPVLLFARIKRFSQPSEVIAPIELLRTAAVLHARGLINSQAIQYNLDWVWPYWVKQQFDPRSTSFIPRAFSLTHINLTHRNWTAVGAPGFSSLAIVDPRGLVTPFYDGWSIDAWYLPENGQLACPSAAKDVRQKLEMKEGVAVSTTAKLSGATILSRLETGANAPSFRITYTCTSDSEGSLVLAFRPFNPEGISFIHSIETSPDGSLWRVNGQDDLRMSETPDSRFFSMYCEGDVASFLKGATDRTRVTCDIGMATGAALFSLKGGREKRVSIDIPFKRKDTRRINAFSGTDWNGFLDDRARLQVPDERFMYLYEGALRTICLHSFQEEMYAGPYTYKHFWFRDACFILHALVCAGISGRLETLIDSFFRRQSPSGYFLSQESEWDSNGQVLWVIARFIELSGTEIRPQWKKPLSAASAWISRKRISSRKSSYRGMFPAGFSAEHLGPIDYYYWDDFWGIAGLRSGSCLAEVEREARKKNELEKQAGEFLATVEESLKKVERRLGRPAMPASPTRRLDSGAIGSLACGYPLQLVAPTDRRLLDTVQFILDSCMMQGMFFHDMSHSGLNPYLTLHVAQVLLRAQDARFFDLMRSVAGHASETGQWPEAVHPATGGGCMGDGQHCWAAAEWVMMQRNCFVREEADSLVLCQGIPREWFAAKETMSFGPAPTSFGTVSVTVTPGLDDDTIAWKGQWRGQEPRIEVRLPGREPVIAPAGAESVIVKNHRT